MQTYKARELLKLSIGFEEDTQKLYQDWAKKFSRVPVVAAFWQDYSEDEATHARLLKELRARLSRAQLATPIECEVVGDTRKLLTSLKKEELEDLEQAFQYANRLEHSELNPLFILIISFFEADEKAKAMLRLLISKHINKPIDNFPVRFLSSELRRELRCNHA